jgi:hypothetical protein
VSRQARQPAGIRPHFPEILAQFRQEPGAGGGFGGWWFRPPRVVLAGNACPLSVYIICREFMSLYSNVALINRFGKVGLDYFNCKERLIKSHPAWNQDKDVRISVFSKCVNVFRSANLGMDFIMLDLTNDNWWQSKSTQTIPDELIKHSIREFDIFLKISFFHLFFSSIESSVRAIVQALDSQACNSGKDDFKNLYVWLLNRLELSKWNNLLDLLRCIRNTIHNNGIYFPKSGKNETIIYKGISYSFIVGSKIGFTWEQLLDFTSDVKDMLLEIIESSEVVSQIAIADPFAQ